MKMHPVESSNLAEVGWSNGTLTVVFRNGSARYTYADVPRGVYLQLLRAPSHGKYFASAIRNNYAFQRVEEGE